MMKSWGRVALAFFILLLIGAGIWGFSYIRRVDGRSPGQWLAFAEQASSMVAYHAKGRSLANNTRATFILDQSTAGRYVMNTRDTQGNLCSLGYDGSQVWYSTETKKEKMAVAAKMAIPVPERAKIVGLGTVAGRAVVRLAIASGHLQKSLAIDRRTGVLLSMTTRMQGHPVSEMLIDSISYQPIDISPCTEECSMRAQSTDRTTLERHLGEKIVEPRWLPDGYTLSDMLLKRCDECEKPMAVLRYADGVGAVTLFEMPQHEMTCTMCTTCRPAATAQTLVASKTVGAFIVTAAGTMDMRTLQRVLDSVQ